MLSAVGGGEAGYTARHARGCGSGGGSPPGRGRASLEGAKVAASVVRVSECVNVCVCMWQDPYYRYTMPCILVKVEGESRSGRQPLRHLSRKKNKLCVTSPSSDRDERRSRARATLARIHTHAHTHAHTLEHARTRTRTRTHTWSDLVTRGVVMPSDGCWQARPRCSTLNPKP